MKDIQAVMRSDVARVEKPTAARKPPTMTIGPKWVAACFDGQRACFLCWAKRYWASTDEPERAHRFETESDAQAACNRASGFEAGVIGTCNRWAPRRMTLKVTFE